jgi:FPC/CPF motif-containing protein YcgG
VTWIDYDIVSECASNHALAAINAETDFSRRFNHDLERRLDDLAARIAAQLGGYRPEGAEGWKRVRPHPKPSLA